MKADSIMAVLVVTAILATGAPLSAQSNDAPRSTGRLIAGGMAVGAAGMAAVGFAGAMVGANTCRAPGDPDSCRGFEGALIGASVGHTIGIPTGVHLANGRAGNLGTSILVSAGIWGAGAAIGFGSGSDKVLAGAAITVPIAQFVSSIAIERATARRRAR